VAWPYSEAQTAGGCDSRRRARQEKPPPPRLAFGARQPAATLGAGTTALAPPGGWVAVRPAGKCRQPL
jgi:hypothetical protein